MNYLLINHVPFAGGANGQFQVGDMWLEDLRAQASAIRAAGMNLIVATPLMEKLDLRTSGSFNAIEIDPAEQGFKYVPLPFYISMKAYLRVRRALKRQLVQAIERADIVHCGYGGHPVALGQVAWPIAGAMKKKRIWVFDGADPFPRLQLHAADERNPIKRVMKKTAVRRFEKFCRQAVREADLVFAHNAAVAERFADAWSDRCHRFDRSFVTDENLIDDAALQQRQEQILDAHQPMRLIAAGRQIAIKGTDQVLRAMQIARSSGAQIELNVMGEGVDLAQFKKLADELKLNGCVRFSGTVAYGKPLFDAWAGGDVMVITNLTAEISRNVLLAMARGLPVLTYANPGTDALIQQNDAGVIVPKGDVNALATAMAALATDRRRLAELIANGLKVAHQHTLNATHRRRAQLATKLLRGV